jgi:hypothetical protein
MHIRLSLRLRLRLHLCHSLFYEQIWVFYMTSALTILLNICFGIEALVQNQSER